MRPPAPDPVAWRGAWGVRPTPLPRGRESPSRLPRCGRGSPARMSFLPSPHPPTPTRPPSPLHTRLIPRNAGSGQSAGAVDGSGLGRNGWFYRRRRRGARGAEGCAAAAARLCPSPPAPSPLPGSLALRVSFCPPAAAGPHGAAGQDVGGGRSPGRAGAGARQCSVRSAARSPSQ